MAFSRPRPRSLQRPGPDLAETAQALVDAADDHAPLLVEDKPSFGDMRVEALREIAADKICTLRPHVRPPL